MCIHAVGATSFTSIRTMECFIVVTGLFGALYNRAEEWGVSRSLTPGGGTILIDSAGRYRESRSALASRRSPVSKPSVNQA